MFDDWKIFFLCQLLPKKNLGYSIVKLKLKCPSLSMILNVMKIISVSSTDPWEKMGQLKENIFYKDNLHTVL